MAKRTDIHSILIIGAGPIVIGQACEFDYSGAQACKVLRAEGYRVILVNSNPATIMTDPDLADATYIEPITPEMVAKVIAAERPDALLPTMGGQTALNTAMALAKDGTLKKYNVELIGANQAAIEMAEDRLLFREAMDRIGLESPRSRVVRSLDEARAALPEIGLPAIIRPSFTMGGTGGGIAYNTEEYEDIVRGGLRASPTTEVLIEESVLGWKEFEMEVVRDKADNCIIICSIENIDPMGVHTGDSITVAPALTLTDKEYQIMRNASIAVLREIGVDTGGSNVQFAVNPADGRLVVIEMNPRVSRSSALASKATGFPIAKVAAQLAVGYTLDELKNEITRVTPASFEPTIDYVVTKIPRFAFEKFPGTQPLLSTSMKSVGEAMAVGRSFAESIQKALRSLETGLTGFNEIAIPGIEAGKVDKDAVRAALARPTPERLLVIAQAIRHGFSVEEIFEVCHYEPWFLRQIEAIVATENEILRDGLPNDPGGLHRLKKMGFSDARLAELSDDRRKVTTPVSVDLRKREERVQQMRLGIGANTELALEEIGQKFAVTRERIRQIETKAIKALANSNAKHASRSAMAEAAVRQRRWELGIHPVYKRIDTCAAEFASLTPYMYSTYEGDGLSPAENESEPTARRKVIILGGGPNRIGQGIEFDYCCVHAAYALREAGIETIMVNCNPETVSTDYDTSDRLYFEPLTAEDVIELVRVEQSNGTLLGVIVQFGGQTPLKLAEALEAAAIPILGTSPDAIDLAEDRKRFQKFLSDLGLRQPDNGTAYSLEEAEVVAQHLGFPLVIRPSYVLGGRAMEIVHDMASVRRYMTNAVKVSGKNPVLLDRYLSDAIEVDVDALSDGKDVYIAGIMEHIEEAGIHSGDSACSLPPYSLQPEIIAEIERQTEAMALRLGVVGLMNVQFAVKDGTVYVLEVNPRASRTVPFVAKATGVPIAKIAARVMAGETLASFAPKRGTGAHVAVKEAVFPFARFPGVDLILGPEMKSTGEVMGLDRDFGRAFAKSQLGSGVALPLSGTVFISVRDRDKPQIIDSARRLVEMGFKLVATRGTAKTLSAANIPVTTVNKVLEGRPHIVDMMVSGQIQLVFNTTEGTQAVSDSFSLRRSALTHGIPYYTTAAGARASVQAIQALRSGSLEVATLQSYFT